MNLKETARKGLQEKQKELNLDAFVEIMDGFIRESAYELVIHKEKGGDLFRIKGAGCGAVVDFYIFMNALPDMFRRMLEEMGGKGEVKVEQLAETLADMLRQEMIKAVEQDE